MDENSFNHEVSRSAENKSGADYTAVAALSTVNCKVNKFKKKIDGNIIELQCSQ